MTSGVGDAAAPPRVPGLRLVADLGAGRCGRRWEAVDEGSGEAVSVEVVPAQALVALDTGAGRAAAAVSRQIAVLRRLHHPHVLGLRRVVDLPDGGRAVVSDHADGGDLTALLTARGRLSAGEVTTVVVPLAQALAAIHRGGLAHGALGPGGVLFTGSGRPLLAGVGSPVLLGVRADDVADPREDVASLARLGLSCLGVGPHDAPHDAPGGPGAPGASGVPGEGLAEVLREYAAGTGRAVGVDDPGGLAMALARAVYSAAPPAPLTMVARRGGAEALPGAAAFPGAAVLPGAAALPDVAALGAEETRLRPPSPGVGAAAPGAAAPGAAAPEESSPPSAVQRPPAPPLVAAPRPPSTPIPLPSTAGSGAAGDEGQGPAGRLVDAARVFSPMASSGAPRAQSSRDTSGASGPGGRARRGLVLVAACLLAVGGLITWRTLAGSADRSERAAALTTPSAPTPARPSGPAPGPQEAVGRLAQLRAAALTSRDDRALLEVDVEGSPALAADRTVLRQLRERGERPIGARSSVLGTTLVAWRSGEAVVEVRSRVDAHVLRRDDGGAPVAVPAGAETRVRLVLRPGGAAGWRIWSVETVPTG